MRLLRLRVDGFGPLRGEYRFSPGRVTLIVDRNETGKSSLLAAVSAALYGLEDDRRSHKVMTPMERWRPWDGGSYRVELELECEGEVTTVKRDFERGTVEVWDERGREVTASFREGKDAFPVGKKLLGLDPEEFEKCALVRQGELDQVVPGDEKARRGGTLQARLEGAADTRGGDTSAAETLQVLQGALRRYTSEEVDFTGTVENAISRLELKRETLASELQALAHDRQQVAGPLEQLARLGDEEQAAREAIARLESERRAAVTGDLARRVAEQRGQREALARLQAEASSLAPYRQVPPDAEADLRETLALREAALKNLAELDARRQEEQNRRRGELEAEIESLRACEGGTIEDADRLVALAAELRRLAADEERMRGEVAGLHDSLGQRGYEPARVEALTARFGALGEEQQKLLGGQGALALAFQTEVADLEQARTVHTETLRQIDALRAGRRQPGWSLAALGAGAAVAGGVVLVVGGDRRLATALLAGGLALGLIGVVLVALADGARRGDRSLAMSGLTDAQRRIKALRLQRAESELVLEEFAARFGARTAVELMREWNEYKALMDESSPVQRVRDQAGALEARRLAALAEARERLARVGGGVPEADHLDAVATGIRRLATVRQSIAELEKSLSWVDEEKRIGATEVTGLHERAVGILRLAGLPYDPDSPWSERVKELAESTRRRARLALLTDELIPQARQRLAPDAEAAELEAQLAALEAEAGGPLGPGAAPARPALDLDREVRAQREIIELVQRRRGDLRQSVDQVVRRAATREPELLAEQARIELALERARRFKRAVELAATTIQEVALETHRRWADFLNRRVGELLAAMGAQLDQVRFGEDLDFSLRLRDGQQAARGKALLQLSAGARDQLHLAVRLAISEFLSRPANPLPLLLDDVFANSDDERARAGMRVLAGSLARDHQVILVTCHRNRHEHLASLDPDVWAAGVQWLELQAAESRA